VKVNYDYAGSLFTMGSTPRPMAAAIKQEIPGIVNTCRVSDEPANLLFSFGDKSLYAAGRYADSSLFSMLTLPFVQGNAENAFKELYSIVITEKTAKKFFGDEKNIVGKTVRLDNKQDYLVTGVIKDIPQNSSLQFEWVAPYEITIAEAIKKWGSNDANNWGSYGPFTYVELNPSADQKAVNWQLYDYIHKKNATETSHSFLFSMNDWHLYNDFSNGKQTGGGQIEQVKLLSIIAWIILLIACINFMNLATAQSEKRAKEVGVRKVLGSGRGRLIAQFMGEALFMSLLSAILSVFIITLALPAFNELVHKNLSLQLSNPVNLAGLTAVTLITGLVAGSYPATFLSSFNPVGVLKGLKIKNGVTGFVRKSLVVIQFTVSVVFIISTLIIYLQIQHIKNRSLGFNKENLVEIRLQHDMSKEFTLLKQDLVHTGLIENAAMANHTILNGGNTDDRFIWEGKQENSSISIAHRKVSSEFMRVAGIKIIDGRDFSEGSIDDNSNVIISKSFASLLGKGSAIGKVIQSPRGQKDGEYKSVTVIGVADDHIYGNMYGTPGPMIFYNQPIDYGNLLYVRTKTGVAIAQALQKIEEVMKKDNAAYPFDYKFVDEQFNEKFTTETLMGKLSTVFAVLAIIISCLGLFGLAAYTAERRIKEIGIRKVLGASVSGIATLISKDFLQLVALSCIIAFPAAWWIMHSWLDGYQYRISISVWIFLAAGIMAMLIAVFTISFQAIKAAMANPVKSLRTE
jgi:predicted permease